MPKNRILVFTGDGKGKTTAALGIILRAQGHKIPTYFVQFMKSAPSGELKMMAQFPELTIERFGLGFVPKPDHTDFPKHKAVAQAGVKAVQNASESNLYNLIVLDEILGAIGAGLIHAEELVELINNLSDHKTLVLTGRDAPQEIIKLADTVTEMTPIKHGYEIGIPAQKGIEF